MLGNPELVEGRSAGPATWFDNPDSYLDNHALYISGMIIAYNLSDNYP